jgi:hypothetical protein
MATFFSARGPRGCTVVEVMDGLSPAAIAIWCALPKKIEPLYDGFI